MADTIRDVRSPRRRRGTRDPSHPPGLGYTPPPATTPRTKSRSATALGPPPPQPLPLQPTSGVLPCITYIVAYHAVVICALVSWHMRTHRGLLNPVQVLLATFCTINVWICICEIALLCYPEEIKRQAAAFAAIYGEGVLPPVFLFQPVRALDVIGLRYWARMWSTYCSLDPSYADTRTLGYCIDIGNGVSMLVPTVLFALGMTMTSDLVEARYLGMLGLVAFYQMFYGTCLYFFQYVRNKRYAKTPRSQVYGIVLLANGIWMAFPALGMWASARLIIDGTYSIFLN
jgi:hypothetical protein